MDLGGGELMHLQRFVLNGLIIGAALFLPTNVFADKADLAKKQPVINELAANAAAVAQKPVNGNANNDSQKQVDGTENKGSHIQAKVEEKIAIKKDPAVSHSSQSSTAKPAQLIKTLPEQASKRAEKAVQEAVEKIDKQPGKKAIPEKAVTNPGEKKGLTEKENQFVHEKPPAQQDESMKIEEPIKPVVTEKPSEQTVQSMEPEEKPKHQVSKGDLSANEIKDAPVSTVKNEPVNKTKDKPVLNKESNAQSLPVFGGPPKDSNSSGTDKSIPHEKQATTPTQSNQHSGGASKDRSNKDRTKVGQGFVNYTDKWLDWGHYWALEISQTYMSRIDELSSQWTNAPPSQPPKSFLFLTIQNQKN
ncbi:hypothetical protein F9802_17155 [Bacillus aerolatus]|uniref:Uncharacterized protein n=1 Tax=Bacillus aerolatus TaxID=2653354 RepID=A0A6I1FBQ2_9BACI|nr:hypothetical protein [Bacillus aerolatus]KAB7704642.1 hypothetical protein F9802_17155 [Bacillus aerolatus]